jgi:S-adenosylmethionine:tRNA ribosyltransferase-isomerase
MTLPFIMNAPLQNDTRTCIIPEKIRNRFVTGKKHGVIYMVKQQKSINFEYSRSAYQYDLPTDLIAQEPASNRGDSRLLIYDREKRSTTGRRFPEVIEYLHPHDLIVVNNTKVFPARILGKKETGGKIELFLLQYPSFEKNSENLQGESTNHAPVFKTHVTALLKSSKRPQRGTKLLFGDSLEGRVEELLPDGKARLTLYFKGGVDDILNSYGRVPLPPYIQRREQDKSWDKERYQTIYARHTGAVAAPTAGLHFSGSFLEQIADKGIRTATITLHVGYGTFAPVRVEDIRKHKLHEEYAIISAKTAQLVNETKKKGGKVWAVGTTTVRSLEFASDEDGRLQAKEGWCGVYIYPGYKLKIVDNLITNFHLPGSSLMYLVAAMTGRENLLKIYQEAIDKRYRFFSYGDAMLVL